MAKVKPVSRKKQLDPRAKSSVISPGQRVLSEVQELIGSLKEEMISPFNIVASRCRKTLKAKRQQLDDFYLNDVMKTKRRCLRVYKMVSDPFRLSFEVVWHIASVIGLNLASIYRRAQIDGKDFHKKFVTQCRQSPEVLKQSYLRAHKKVTRPFQQGFEVIGHSASRAGLNVASVYRRAQIDTKDFCKKSVAQSKEAIKITRRQIMTIGPRVARRYRQIRFASQLAYRDFVETCHRVPKEVRTKIRKIDRLAQRKAERELAAIANARKRVLSSWVMGFAEMGHRISFFAQAVKESKLQKSHAENQDLWIPSIDPTTIKGAQATTVMPFGRIVQMGDLLDDNRGPDRVIQNLGFNPSQEGQSLQPIGVELEIL